MKAINITLWVIQAMVAAAMIFHGVLFLFPPQAVQEVMAKNPSPCPQSFMQFIFAMEALGGIGLILPAATRILPFLTPLAAAGLTLLTLSATGYHLWMGDWRRALIPAILSLLCAFVAEGRTRFVQIPARPRPPHLQTS